MLIILGRSDLRLDYPPDKDIGYATWDDINDEAKAVIIESKYPRMIFQNFPKWDAMRDAVYQGELIDWEKFPTATGFDEMTTNWLIEEITDWIHTWDDLELQDDETDFYDEQGEPILPLSIALYKLESGIPLQRAELTEVLTQLSHKLSDGG